MSEELDKSKLKGPIEPKKLTLESRVKFRCHKEISCFNKCCKNIDIILTPYDILRLKKRLGLSSEQFISNHTDHFEMDAHGMPGVRLRHQKESQACPFLREEGCSVYSDRPTVCRYYPVGQMGMRKQDEYHMDDVYFLVKEDHCKGHEEEQVMTVDEFRVDQGVDAYDEMNREWREIILKKRSFGPTIGKPSDRSFRLFHTASYDLDRFKRFVFTEEFLALVKLPDDYLKKIQGDEEEFLLFSLRYLKQVLYGEQSFEVDEGERARIAAEKEALRKKYEGVESEAFFPPGSRFDTEL